MSMTIKQAFEKLTMVCGAALKNPFFVQRNLHDAFADIAANIEESGGGSTVEVTQVLESGTKIATITVDEESTDLYAPSQLHAYSTTEKVVGKWVDNSDIYEITFTALSTTTTGANWCEISGTDIPNLSKVLNCRAYNIAVDGNYINMAIAETAKSPNSRVQLTVAPGYDREINYMIVQYTKSS